MWGFPKVDESTLLTMELLSCTKDRSYNLFFCFVRHHCAVIFKSNYETPRDNVFKSKKFREISFLGSRLWCEILEDQRIIGQNKNNYPLLHFFQAQILAQPYSMNDTHFLLNYQFLKAHQVRFPYYRNAYAGNSSQTYANLYYAISKKANLY